MEEKKRERREEGRRGVIWTVRPSPFALSSIEVLFLLTGPVNGGTYVGGTKDDTIVPYLVFL